MKHLKHIFENKSLQDVDEIEISNTVIKEIGLDSSKEEYMIALFLAEEGSSNYEDMSEDEITETPEYKNWLQYEIEYRFGELKDKFLKLKNENSEIEIYREMKVPANWIDNLKNPAHLGIYWSYDKKAAEAHWGYDGDIHVLITATVKFDKINWQDTFLANLDVNIGDMEKEIRLYEDTALNVIDIESKNISINFPKISYLA